MEKIKKIYNNIKRFFTTIKNIIDWIPILYKDRNWDFYYIYVILKFKLEKTKTLMENGYGDNTYKVSRINLAINLLDKLIKNYYTDEYESYGETELIPPTYELKTIWEKYDEYIEKNLSNLRRLKNTQYDYFSKDIDYFDTEGLSAEDKRHIAMDISHYKHEKCKKLLFSIMEYHIESWWD